MEKLKRVSSILFTALAILLFGGLPLMYLYIIASLGGTPLYITRIIPVVGIGFLLLLCALSFLPRLWYRRVGICFLCVCLGCGCYAAWGAYHDSIPTVDDRNLLLYEYEPFSQNSKAVTLDEPSTLQFNYEQARSLRLDGATALYPVYAAFVQAVFPVDNYPRYSSEGYDTVTCSNTVNAYERLIQGETDIIFVAGPSQQQLEQAEKAGVQLHLTPIGREAFVFFVNSKNPVNSLSVEQIQGIYSGTITNWSQVGGKHQSIRPFQRTENSGSQTSLQKLMAGLPLLEPEEEDRVADMGGIIRQVASYRNYKNAIGFSFRFYATEMVANEEIKLLALNGVIPTKQTIRDGSYPIASEFYAVTASPIGAPPPQEENETMAAFLDWVLSEQGQALVEQSGYVACNP